MSYELGIFKSILTHVNFQPPSSNFQLTQSSSYSFDFIFFPSEI